MVAAKKPSVLIVDDEADLREVLVFDFTRKGFETHAAANGREAFDLLQRTPVDVVISDIRMPGGDGVELLRRIREKSKEFPRLLFMSGFSDITLEEAYDLGAEAVFMKPFDRKALFETVSRVLLSKDARWPSRTERLGLALNIELHLPGSDSPLSAQTHNFGRGGFFVVLENRFPQIGEIVAFKMDLENDAGNLLEGTGIVRWVRRETSPEGLPPGCGIEFTSLAEHSRQAVLQLVNSIKTRAFIPKS